MLNFVLVYTLSFNIFFILVRILIKSDPLNMNYQHIQNFVAYLLDRYRVWLKSFCGALVGESSTLLT